MSTKILSFEVQVKASPQLVYEAFTNSTSLREWFCDIASVEPIPGGRVILGWNSGFYAAGEYLEVQKNEKIVLSWFGRGEPAPTRVAVTIIPANDGTKIHLEHQGVGAGPEWEATTEEINKGWNSSLENLVSVLETGEDLRFTLRPMLGITVSDFNEQIAEQLGLPVSEGIRIDNAIDGMGASAAGLQGGDVIISMDGKAITGFSSLAAILSGRRAGERVEVIFYRDGERHNLQMELSGRPLPEIPATLQELADFMTDRHNNIQRELDDFFSGVTEAEADFKPTPEEWSVKEVLAHLIHGERFLQRWVTELLARSESYQDDSPGNLRAPIDATVAAFPALSDLREEYRCSGKETIALVASCPDDFLQHKGSYWRIAYSIIEDPYHHRVHLDQMNKAIEAARM